MMRVLLADDDTLELLYLSNILQNYGEKYSIVGRANNGLQAVELAYTLRPDMILMDIKMPGIDGLEATKRIKKCQPACTVIIISAYDDFDHARKAIQSKADDYLLKPVAEDEVLAALSCFYQKRNHENTATPIIEFQDSHAGVFPQDCSASKIGRRVISYININYASDLSLEAIAKDYYVSPSYLSKIIKKETGHTFTEYLNRLRIKQAKTLLKTSDQAISRIAYLVGYKDVSHFNRCFRKIVGANPSQYRKMVMDTLDKH